MKACSNKKSSVPGDLPPRLFNEDDVRLALSEPATKIMNMIAKSGEWPDQFKIEWGTPLQKENNADIESQLRIISCTNQLSKAFERVVLSWLMLYVKDKLDPDQLGGQKGNSVTHYLIEITNFILYNQDLKDPHATLAVFYDFSQGFNRIQYSTLIEVLSNMKVPGWLLRLMIGYLTGRILRVRYKGIISSDKELNAGTGQGCLLGMWCFLFLCNSAGPEKSNINIGEIITKPLQQRRPIVQMKKKWIDDMTVVGSLNLKKSLISDESIFLNGPVTYHNRTGHNLPASENFIQHDMDAIQKYATDHHMLINKKKTKAMLFNPHVKYDFMPQLTLTQGSDNIEVVEKCKVLGQIIRSDLKTISNTEYICKKAYQRMWVIRRLKSLGCDNNDLLDVLKQQVLSVLEQAVPFWGPLLTKVESVMIERVLKTGLHIVYQSEYKSFTQCLELAKLKSLSQRRKDMIFIFSKKSLKSDKFNDWFKQDNGLCNTRHKKPAYKPVTCRTLKYERSSLPVMTRAVSWHPPKVYISPNIY